MITAEVTELERWVDKALSADATLLDDETLIGTTRAVAAIAAKVDALRVRLAAAVDDSGVWATRQHANPAALLRKLAPNRHTAAASTAIRLAERLRQMPHAQAAFNDGSITTDHVRLLGECLHARFEGQFEAFEEELVSHAIELPFAQFQRLIAAWKTWADDAVDADKDLKDAAAREVHLSRTLNQRGALRGTLTPLARSIVDNELRRLERHMFDADWTDATSRLGEGNVTKHDLRRTPAQRRHDALVWMAMRSAAAGTDNDESAGPLAMIYVHTTEAELTQALTGEAEAEPVDASGTRPPHRVRYDESLRELDDHTPISPGTLARLALQSHVRRVVFSPTGEIIDAGRARRLFSPLQRELVAARDRHCACGCGLPARHCDIDHTVEWRHGGRTDLANAQPLCPSAHRKKTNANHRRPPP